MIEEKQLYALITPSMNDGESTEIVPFKKLGEYFEQFEYLYADLDKEEIKIQFRYKPKTWYENTPEL